MKPKHAPRCPRLPSVRTFPIFNQAFEADTPKAVERFLLTHSSLEKGLIFRLLPYRSRALDHQERLIGLFLRLRTHAYFFSSSKAEAWKLNMLLKYACQTEAASSCSNSGRISPVNNGSLGDSTQKSCITNKYDLIRQAN